jgi:hypothetical protein
MKRYCSECLFVRCCFDGGIVWRVVRKAELSCSGALLTDVVRLDRYRPLEAHSLPLMLGGSPKARIDKLFSIAFNDMTDPVCYKSHSSGVLGMQATALPTLWQIPMCYQSRMIVQATTPSELL